MPEITLVRTNIELPPEEDLQVIRKFIFGVVDGARETDKKSWRRFWGGILRLGSGEMALVDLIFPRNPKFHRKFFALLGVGYDAWEPGRKHKTYKGKPIAKNFDQFREDVIILAGYYDQTFTLRGDMRLKAQSIRFSKMNQDQFEELYSAVADVLLREVLTKYAGREELDEVVNKIISMT
jgi:hypothetical protein